MTRFILILVLALVGCTRLPDAPEGMPTLTPCLATVHVDGKPMEGVSVLFRPNIAPGVDVPSWPAGGKTDTTGMTVMKTANYYAGVVPGDYVISFQKHAPEEFTADGMAKPTQSLLPEKYSSRLSKEMVTVTTEKKEYVFDLETVAK